MTTGRKRLAIALFLAAIASLYVVPLALAQGGEPVIPDPTTAALATAAGIAAVVALITNVLRTVVPAGVFDAWGPTIAVVVGIVLGLLGVIVGPGPIDGDRLLTAVLVGLFGGWQSQNVNTQVTRAINGPPQ